MLFRSPLSLRAFVLSMSFACTALVGCSTSPDLDEEVSGHDEPITSVTSGQRVAAQQQDISKFTFEGLTPTSTSIMRAAHWWMHEQRSDRRYPKARQCASNVSKVLFLAGIEEYDQEGVRALIADVKGSGGHTFDMPQNPAGFAKVVNEKLGGVLAAGTLVAGMNVRTSAPGDQHIGFIGHVDPDGTVWIYHNNWYRPENEGGARKDYMVSKENLAAGFPRQWMATPWVRVTRDSAGKVTNVVSLMPAIDDMDPFNASFRVTLAILPEVAKEASP